MRPTRFCAAPLAGRVFLALVSAILCAFAGCAAAEGATLATSAVAPANLPLELAFEQLPDYWLALPTTISLSATPLPCQAGSLTARYTIGPDGVVADPVVVASTLDVPHQTEAVAWIVQARYAAAPANAVHKAVRVSQQMKVSCG